MTTRFVTHVIKNNEDDIRYLCNLLADWSPRSVEEIILDIEDGIHDYVVRLPNFPDVPIIVVNDSDGRYLRTTPDSTFDNNLDDLPRSEPNFLNDYPNDKSSNWSDSLQGVTHSRDHWFFTQETKLLKFHLSTDLHINSTSAIAIANMPPELNDLGCNHFGDPDYWTVNGQGYIFIPVEGAVRYEIGTGNEIIKVIDDCQSEPRLAVFRDDAQLSYIGSALLPSQNSQQDSARAGWCAINPIDGLLYTSHNHISSEFPVFRYEIDFLALEQNQVLLESRTNFDLHDNGSPVEITQYVQGGCFSPDGTLFLCNGKINESPSDGGIRAFDLSGQLMYRSSLSRHPFKYEYRPGFPWPAQEPEGITYWNLDALPPQIIAPNIEGQLHAVLLDKALGDDHIYFKHYRIG